MSPARIESGRLRAVPVTELGPCVPPTPIWPGYIFRGHVTLLTALWKSGKTTLVAHLLRDLTRGGGLVLEMVPMKVLVISEESTSLWIRRRDELGLSASVHISCRPFKIRPTFPEWVALIAEVAEAVRREGYGLVVIDTLPSLWPVTDENDASAVGSALMPLTAITELGVGLLLLHHPRKGDAGEGQASRGSGALPGWVDVVLEMRRYAPGDAHDRRRVLRAYSRFDETPPEAVLELTPTGYAVVGDKAEVRQSDRLRMIAEILPIGGDGLTSEEVHGAWSGQPKPGKRTIEGDLADGVDGARWNRLGSGHKGSPYRYRRSAECDSRTVDGIGAGTTTTTNLACDDERNGDDGAGPLPAHPGDDLPI